MRLIILLMMNLFVSFHFAKADVIKRVKKPSPYQVQIDKCFTGALPIAELYNNKQLYYEITKKFTLQASETTYREVVYTVGNERRKLKYEDGKATVYKVDSDEKLTLISTEQLGKDPKSSGMRYKIVGREAILNQYLSQAKIVSDFMKTTEYRSKQVILNLAWSDSQIKSLGVQFEGETKKLECIRKDTADICDCRS